jgi:hypothetical protein
MHHVWSTHLRPFQQLERRVGLHLNAGCGRQETVVAHVDGQLQALSRGGKLAKLEPRPASRVKPARFLHMKGNDTVLTALVTWILAGAYYFSGAPTKLLVICGVRSPSLSHSAPGS